MSLDFIEERIFIFLVDWMFEDFIVELEEIFLEKMLCHSLKHIFDPGEGNNVMY